MVEDVFFLITDTATLPADFLFRMVLLLAQCLFSTSCTNLNVMSLQVGAFTFGNVKSDLAVRIYFGVNRGWYSWNVFMPSFSSGADAVCSHLEIYLGVPTHTRSNVHWGDGLIECAVGWTLYLQACAERVGAAGSWPRTQLQSSFTLLAGWRGIWGTMNCHYWKHSLIRMYVATSVFKVMTHWSCSFGLIFLHWLRKGSFTPYCAVVGRCLWCTHGLINCSKS